MISSWYFCVNTWIVLNQLWDSVRAPSPFWLGVERADTLRTNLQNSLRNVELAPLWCCRTGVLGMAPAQGTVLSRFVAAQCSLSLSQLWYNTWRSLRGHPSEDQACRVYLGRQMCCWLICAPGLLGKVHGVGVSMWNGFCLYVPKFCSSSSQHMHLPLGELCCARS